MALPYENARSGLNARQEIIRILRRFGCEKVGFMDEFETRSVILAFVWRGRHVQLRASAQGWANAWLAENPWTPRRRSTRKEWESAALEQGMVAVNSILRDWVKGQVTAIETGILTFEHVFMPFMVAADGRPLVEHARKLLPATDGEASANA
ncbi:MAG: hypothetical protein D6826_10035 [Alphaproteobacteria bacterium]|nr:MAG: hypothetical protein D6826_10035 [Alphaproteobacteria bacterium]